MKARIKIRNANKYPVLNVGIFAIRTRRPRKNEKPDGSTCFGPYVRLAKPVFQASISHPSGFCVHEANASKEFPTVAKADAWLSRRTKGCKLIQVDGDWANLPNEMGIHLADLWLASEFKV